MWNKEHPELFQADLMQMREFFPSFTQIFSDAGRLEGWEGTVTPVPSFEEYTLRVFYPEGYPQTMPKAKVISPDIFFLYYRGGVSGSHPHFNGDGTICSLFPPDKTWQAGRETIAHFVGHCCIWLVGHLYWREFGEWPLQQAPHGSRLMFHYLNGRDLCYCGSGKLYKHCHRKNDRKFR